MNDITRRLFDRSLYASIATSDENGRPWNTPVIYAHDDSGNVYWSSHPESVHSINIDKNPRVFIVIFNTYISEDKYTGLYIDASAEVLNSKEEIKKALKLSGKRRGKPFKYSEKFISPGPQRIYKAIPKNIWINQANRDDDGDFIRDYRISLQDNLKDIL